MNATAEENISQYREIDKSGMRAELEFNSETTLPSAIEQTASQLSLPLF